MKRINIKNAFLKSVEKNKNISTEGSKPKFWLSSGNYLINKVLAGRYTGCFPQGRISGLTGPSGSGKSFILSNAINQAVKEEYSVLIIDSERALDEEYLAKIGVDVESESISYISTNRITDAAGSIQSMCKFYHDARTSGEIDDMPKLLIVVDSLDALYTDSMMDKYDETGDLGNDQGLHAKKLKQLLQTLVYNVGLLPAIVICTKQPYVDQTPNVAIPWKISEAIKYPFTVLGLITKLMEKDAKTKEYNGIKLRVFGFKTRLTKPYQRCEILVPYDTGLDPYEGLLPVAVAEGIVTQKGAWFYFGEHKFQGANAWHPYKEAIFQAIVAKDVKYIDIAEGEEELPAGITPTKKAEMKDAIKRLQEKVKRGEKIDDEDEGAA
jgi:RecA/RadA recombinase